MGKNSPAGLKTRSLRKKLLRLVMTPEEREAERAFKADYYQKNKADCLRYTFERKYGITYEQRGALLAAQGGCCAICGSTDHKAKSRGWHTDHDDTKKKGEPGFIRGVLCAECNTGLGKFEHDPERLRKAAEYLERTMAMPAEKLDQPLPLGK